MPQFREATGLRRGAATTAVGRLKAADVVVAWPAASNTTYQARGETNLAVLEALAERAVDETAKRSAGRRTSVDGSREVRSITSSQFVKIRTATNTLARYLDPGAGRDGDRLKAAKQRVVGEHLAWDATAGAGDAGDWRAITDLTMAASSKGMRAENVAALRLLLDLAATRGWIARTERHDPTYAPVPPEWAPFFATWRQRHDVPPAALKELLRACSSLGMTDPTTGDWTQVVEHLEAAWAGGAKTTKDLRNSTRRAYRALKRTGEISGPEWNGIERRRREGYTLVRRSTINALAELYGADGAQEGLRGGAWPEEFGQYPGLVDGEYGLGSFLIWATVPSDEADLYGARPRDVYPNDAVRGASPRSSTPWRAGTLVKRLGELLFYAGWLERHRGVDWTIRDLRALIEENNIMAFREAIVGGLSSKGRLRTTAITLSRVASPWAEWVAWEAGEEKVQRQFHRTSQLLYSNSSVDGRASIVNQLTKAAKGTGKGRRRLLRAKARKIEDAFTRRKEVAPYAYGQMRAILRASVADLEAEFGPLDHQIADPPKALRWARRVRDVALIQDQLVVPLRFETLASSDLENRHHTSDYRRVWGEYRGRNLKSGSNSDEVEFEPVYQEPGGGYETRVYHLYRDHARAVLAQVGERAYYVNNRGTRYGRSQDVNSLIRRVAKRALEHDTDVIGGVTFEEVRGVCTSHCFRHMVATKLVSEGRILDAALLLNHSSLDMVREVYAAQDERNVCAAHLLN